MKLATCSSLLLALLAAGTVVPASGQSQAQTDARLETMMDKFDTPALWRNAPTHMPQQQPAAQPPAQPAWSRDRMSPQQINSALHGIDSPWNRQAATAGSPANAQQGWTASPAVPQDIYGGKNPFDLSPFGMLHYMWDDTTYTSSADPVSLYEVRSDLQQAQQYSTLAQSAASRAKYAATPQERQEAAAEAQKYAQLSQAAASRANTVAMGGSANPADVAALAQQQAAQAQAAASQASARALGKSF